VKKTPLDGPNEGFGANTPDPSPFFGSHLPGSSCKRQANDNENKTMTGGLALALLLVGAFAGASYPALPASALR
jgi:hypothetical protein